MSAGPETQPAGLVPVTRNGIALAVQRVPPETAAGRRLLALYDESFHPTWETFGEAVAAIEAEAARSDLGSAWAEAEAALPADSDEWAWGVNRRHGGGDEGYYAFAEEAHCGIVRQCRCKQAFGPTPAAALRALAAVLADAGEGAGGPQ